MKAVFITRHGGPGVLRLEESATPEPGPGQVRLAIKAAGINFADLMQRMGLYPSPLKPPYVPGFEAAGIVEAIGGGVTGLQVGARVAAMLPSGGYASHVVADASRVVPLPSQMCFEEAAALPVNYLTAYHMMVHLGRLAKGQRILIHMAAGGVGIAAVQIAREIGAEIFGTASASKHAVLREQGVHHPIDYRTLDFATEVRRIAGPAGVDMVLDSLGGSATAKNYDLLAPGGKLMIFGFARAVAGDRMTLTTIFEALRMPKFGPRQLMMDNKSVFGVHLGRMNTPAELAVVGRELEELLRLYATGKIKPLVGKTFPLGEAAEAHRFIQRRENVGKVVLIP